jgi:vacuolar iron transporter family protein
VSLQARCLKAACTVQCRSPLLAIWLPPATFRLPVTFAAVLIALGLADALRAGIGGSHVGRAVLWVVIGGPDE